MLLNGGCGTTAGWKTSPYVHLLLGGKPRASCTPHSMTSRAGSEINSKTKYLFWGRVPVVTVSNKLYDYINTKLGINNDLTLMIPAFPLLAFELLLLMNCWPVCQICSSFQPEKKIRIHFHLIANLFRTPCWLLTSRYFLKQS